VPEASERKMIIGWWRKGKAYRRRKDNRFNLIYLEPLRGGLSCMVLLKGKDRDSTKTSQNKL
jgi:hypothetical protein